MRGIGWIDSFLPLIVPSFLVGSFGTFMLREYFASLPNEYGEAARIDVTLNERQARPLGDRRTDGQQTETAVHDRIALRARAIRILLHELALDYEPLEETTTPLVDSRAAATSTLQVPTLWDGDIRLWESGLIAEYLLATYPNPPDTHIPLAAAPWRAGHIWQDKLVFSTIQTFGTAATAPKKLGHSK